MAEISTAADSRTGEEIVSTTSLQYQVNQYRSNDYWGGVSEIEEVNTTDEVVDQNNGNGGSLAAVKDEIGGSLSSFCDVQNGDDNVYVAVGKSESSMDALAWTLKNAVNNPSTFVYLIHVFPELHHIPTPLGKLPRNRVSPEQVENYMAQERGKRREFLQKFVDTGSASKVNVDTMLIESDTVAKTILDLIPILNIKKLVLGANKSSLRKLRSRKGNGIADQILQNAPEGCDVTVVCEGKEVSVEQINGLLSPRDSDSSPNFTPEGGGQQQKEDSFPCACFKPKCL